GLARGITRKPLLACLEELLRPAVIEALGDTLTAAKAGDALLAAQARQDDPDLLLRGIVLPGLPLDPTDQPVGRVLRCSGCLVHLRSMVASMNQKSSVTQTLKSVRRVLTSDKRHKLVADRGQRRADHDGYGPVLQREPRLVGELVHDQHDVAGAARFPERRDGPLHAPAGAVETHE